MKTSGLWAILIALVLMTSFFSSTQLHSAYAAQTITAYQSQVPVTISGTYVPSQWSDTPVFKESTSGMQVAFKQNGTGLLFLMSWTYGVGDCTDQSCFGGIEIGELNNTAEMGSAITPTIMILASPSFTKGYDEFISTSDSTPETVEAAGYKTQSTCGTNFSGSTWIVQCYRPFKLSDASPYDPFPTLASGSPIEIGFAVGLFDNPGVHLATDMSTYTLVTSSQTTTITTTQTLGSASTSTSSTSHTSTTSSVSTSSVTSSSSLTSTSSSGTVTSSSSNTTTQSSISTTSSGVASSVTATTSVTTARVSGAANTYAEELLVIIVGFSLIMVVVARRYEKA